jgi:hypothetical protein
MFDQAISRICLDQSREQTRACPSFRLYPLVLPLLPPVRSGYVGSSTTRGFPERFRRQKREQLSVQHKLNSQRSNIRLFPLTLQYSTIQDTRYFLRLPSRRRLYKDKTIRQKDSIVERGNKHTVSWMIQKIFIWRNPHHGGKT